MSASIDNPDLIWVTHPGIDQAAQVNRSALPHMDGWSEIKNPDRSPKVRAAVEAPEVSGPAGDDVSPKKEN